MTGNRKWCVLLLTAAVLALGATAAGPARACQEMSDEGYYCNAGQFAYSECSLSSPCFLSGVNADRVTIDYCGTWPIKGCQNEQSCQCDTWDPGCEPGWDCEYT